MSMLSPANSFTLNIQISSSNVTFSYFMIEASIKTSYQRIQYTITGVKNNPTNIQIKAVFFGSLKLYTIAEVLIKCIIVYNRALPLNRY